MKFCAQDIGKPRVFYRKPQAPELSFYTIIPVLHGLRKAHQCWQRKQTPTQSKNYVRTRQILDGGQLVGTHYSLSYNGKGCPQKKYLILTKYEFVELLQLHCQPKETFCWICFNLINILISFIGLASRTILILLVCNNHWWICVTINSL